MKKRTAQFSPSWLKILQEARADIDGAESEIERLEKLLHERRDRERRLVRITFPDDVKLLIGGESQIILAEMCRGGPGRNRNYMDGRCYIINDGMQVDGDGFKFQLTWFNSSRLQSKLGDLPRDIGFGYGLSERKSRQLAKFTPDVIPLSDHGVCLKCGRRAEIASVAPERMWHDGFESADAFWDAIRLLAGRPFERFAESSEMPNHGCDTEYKSLLRQAKDQRRQSREHRLRRREAEERAELAFDSEEPWVSSRDKPTSIYLMKHGINGYHKIGRSANPSTRERTLAAEDPKIELLWQVVGYARDEEALHQLFADKRVRGEWFDLADEDVSWIKSISHRREIHARAGS